MYVIPVCLNALYKACCFHHNISALAWHGKFPALFANAEHRKRFPLTHSSSFWVLSVSNTMIMIPYLLYLLNLNKRSYWSLVVVQIWWILDWSRFRLWSLKVLTGIEPTLCLNFILLLLSSLLACRLAYKVIFKLFNIIDLSHL